MKKKNPKALAGTQHQQFAPYGSKINPKLYQKRKPETIPTTLSRQPADQESVAETYNYIHTNNPIRNILLL